MFAVKQLEQNRVTDRRTSLGNALSYTASALENEASRSTAMGAAMLMGLNDPVFKATAFGEMSPDASEVLHRLAIARSLFGADGAYIISAKGVILAHSTEGTRSTGSNVGFRPYFKSAMKGDPSVYAAVGSVTSERGMYYAAPLYEGNLPTGKVIGVLMLKMPISKLDLLLRFAGGQALLMSPQGIAFSSTNPKWLLSMTPPVTDARVAEVRNLQQFAGHFSRIPPIALPFSPDAETFDLDGRRHIALVKPVQWNDPAGPWSVVSVHNIDDIVSPALRWVVGVSVFATLATLGILLAQVLISRRRILAARARYATLGSALEVSPLSVVIVNFDGFIDWVNPNFVIDSGYTAAELLGTHVNKILTSRTEASLFDTMVAQVRDGLTWRGDLSNQRKDGSLFQADTRVSPVFSTQGKVNGFVVMQEDLTQARQLQTQLAEQISFQNVLLDTIPIPVFYKGADARFMGFNSAFEQTFRLKRDDMVGKHLMELTEYSDHDRQHYLQEDARIIQEASTVRRVLKLPYGDGTVHSTLYFVQGFRKQNGAPGGLIGTFVDISDQEEAKEQLKKAKEAADAASRTKGDFLANMSHEIRTPMNAIIGMAYLAMKTDLTSRQSDLISKIQQAGKNLLSIIDDILDISKVEAGKLNIERVPFELDNVVNHVLNVVSDKASAKGLTLKCEVAPDVPPTLLGDPLRLGQILINYANNAVKFTSSGGITITIYIKEMIQDDLLLRFDVIDTGIGISAEQSKNLFRSFEQADASTTRNYGGTGLGLAISKGLAGLMGGAVGMTSVPKEGSTFWFTARVGLGVKTVYGPLSEFGSLYAAAALSDEHQQARAALVPLSGARILLVEDNELNQQVASELLKEVGMSVTVASNGRKAVECVAASNSDRAPFDMVLMDLQMPVMDGLTATKMIKLDAGNESLPIAALTANIMQEVRLQCLNAGMVGFVVKPIEPIDLWRTLAHLIKPRTGLGSRTNATPLTTSLEPFTAPTTESVLSDLAGIDGLDATLGLHRVLGRQSLYIELLRKFTGSQANALNELQAALDVQDQDSAERIAHTLRGVAGNIGAIQLAAASAQLEATIRSKAGTTAIAAEMVKPRQLLKKLIARLQEKLPQIQAMAQADTDPSLQISAVCNRLALLLAEQDFEAEEVFEKHHEVLRITLGDGFPGLKAAMQIFKFDRALIALNEACAACHIRLNP